MATVLLFDIDGTLVRTGGAGKAAVESALAEHFGVREIRDGIPFSGRTDPAILADILELHDLDPTPDNLSSFSIAYLERLPAQLTRLQGQPCPGVMELLPRIQHHHLGLLTGNVRRGAEHKLRHYGLWDYFRFGGFGDDQPCRDDVARCAWNAIQTHVGAVPGDNIWVIGDTPLDVQCARAIGARAVAVATGWDSLGTLQATGADLVLESLADFSRLPADWFRDPV